MNDDRAPINPLHFFQIGGNCAYLKDYAKKGFPSLNLKDLRKFLLPETGKISGNYVDSEVALGWHEEGLEAAIKVPLDKNPQPQFPEVSLGDSVELFIDTRDVKTSGYNTRYCHHFFFLPEAIEGIIAGERTRFRTEDSHPLCDPQELKVISKSTSFGYTLNIWIPSQCLYGYDPEQFNRIGFNYRINFAGKKSPQEFSTLTEDFQVEQQPSLWSSLNLSK